MASDRSYRQLRNIQDDDFSDEENNAFAPLAGQHQSGSKYQDRDQRATVQTHGGRSCGRGRATCIVLVVLTLVLCIAVVSSMARPRCSREAETTVPLHTSRPSNSPPSATTPTPTRSPYVWNNIRLPTNVKPISYDIFLHPNLTTDSVEGNVEILAEVVNATSFIVLHVKNMTITDVNVKKSGEKIEYKEHQNNIALEQFDIVFQNDIEEGVVMIMLNFTYGLRNGLQGFYRSTYETEEGVNKIIGTTQFEASDARAAFPCFDEPAFKATFTLKMVRAKEHHTLFNMPLNHTEPYGDNVLDVFQTSLKMSTYLVAFVVSEFKNKTYMVRENLEIGVHSPAQEIDEMDFSLEVLNKTITYYEDYFGVAYPLPKQDMVAIPDFGAGAMENWGLITYRKVDILYNNKSTSVSQKQRIVIVITHELAHQWFGNLVTMKWWNDLWLNEGFASYVEYVGTDHWNPEWQIMDQFILYATHSALAIDCLNSSHPISVKVESPDEISDLFDAISYNKGASIIRMLKEHLGEDTFLRGLKNYLEIHAYSNADSNDLWNSLSNSSGVDVKNMMDTWTIQKGYPVVTMSRVNNKIEASQKQFFLMEDFKPTEKNLWIIPLTYVTDKGKSASVLFENVEKAPSIDIDSSVKWFKGNVEQRGFYRVTYDDDNWDALVKQLQENHTVFTPADRASLVDDAHYLARAGLLKYTTALNLSHYISKELNYVPITTALGRFDYIGRMLQKTRDYVLYKKYMWQLTDNWISQFGWVEKDTDSHLTKLLRVSVLSFAVQIGHEGTIARALEMFRPWRQNGTEFNVNLKYTVYCAAARNGLSSDWEFLWESYLETKVASEKNVLMAAMACTSDPSHIYRYLYSTVDGSVRQQDVSIVIASVASNPIGAQPAWLFLQQNWEKLTEMFGTSSFAFGGIIESCTSSIASSVEEQQAKNFFSEQLDARSGSRSIQQALEKMEINVNWLEKNQHIVRQWLKYYSTP
ncbi:endoplasmic reticulum aminopeptidase 1-like [Anneissia japonica]|uniref:endoplasmic reticulum aminopeptidase 1-like n=1 Tax=Anneissia japonica TaxID=1529436 RepID=UPI0014256D09|nr:endoplasmic reticulum aminopeptidase 1-like [Anneissia japonica]